MAIILLTGVTGAVGSSLAPVLLKRGHQLVCLVRGSDPGERLQRILGHMEGVVPFAGDIVLPNLGAGEDQRAKWRGKIDMLLHCASSIRFDERLAAETELANVQGTRNILDFAEDMRIPQVHYVSTAYVAGDAEVFRESDMDIGQKPRNAYERTKLQAEKMVKSWSGGKHTILRLGIVIGDTETGWTPSFNGYYVFARYYWRFKQTVRQEPARYMDAGIVFNDADVLTLPINGGFSPDSTLNLVPIDWAAKTMANLVELPADGTVYHVTHQSPPQGRWINDTSLKHMGIVGIRYGERLNGESNRSLAGIQAVFDRGIGMYLPYIRHEARFEVQNLPRALGAKYVPAPEIDLPIIARWLDYAIEANFGRE